MYIVPFTFRQFNKIQQPQKTHMPAQDNITREPCELVEAFCESFVLPDENFNHSRFDENLAKKIAAYTDSATEPVTDMLQATDDEKKATAGLFLLNRIIDAGAKNVGNTYHIISKFNNSDSPNVQTMLAGIYRKTQVPDGFAPLMTMYLKNAKSPKTNPFNPDEEICGAMLAYLGNTQMTDALLEYLKKNNPISAVNSYSDFLQS